MDFIGPEGDEARAMMREFRQADNPLQQQSSSAANIRSPASLLRQSSPGGRGFGTGFGGGNLSVSLQSEDSIDSDRICGELSMSVDESM